MRKALNFSNRRKLGLNLAHNFLMQTILDCEAIFDALSVILAASCSTWSACTEHMATKAESAWRLAPRQRPLTLIPLNGNSIERVESRFSILGLERTQNSRRENQPFLLLLKMFIPKEANLTDLPSLRQGEPKKPPVRGEEGGGRAQGRPWWRAQRGEEQPAQH